MILNLPKEVMVAIERHRFELTRSSSNLVFYLTHHPEVTFDDKYVKDCVTECAEKALCFVAARHAMLQYYGYRSDCYFDIDYEGVYVDVNGARLPEDPDFRGLPEELHERIAEEFGYMIVAEQLMLTYLETHLRDDDGSALDDAVFDKLNENMMECKKSLSVVLGEVLELLGIAEQKSYCYIDISQCRALVIPT